MALRDHLILVRLGQNRATEKEDHSLWLNRHNFICQALKWEAHCWWDQKRKKLLCHFSPFLCSEFFLVCPLPPPQPSSSLPGHKREGKQKCWRLKGNPHLSQYSEYCIWNVRGVINLTLMEQGVSFVSAGCERGFSELYTYPSKHFSPQDLCECSPYTASR